MKVNFCWYTYERDSEIIGHSVKSIQSCFPEAKLYVYEDGLHPLSDASRCELTDLGAVTKKTWFYRGGSLNGMECVRGILGGLKEASGDCDWVAKIDSDSLVLKNDYLLSLLEKGNEFQQCGFGRHNADFCWGGLYFIKAEILTQILLMLSHSGSILYDPSGRFAEDSTISTLVKYVATHESVYVDRFMKHHDNIVFWDYNTNLNQVTKKTNIVNFGHGNAKRDPLFFPKRNDLMRSFVESQNNA